MANLPIELPNWRERDSRRHIPIFRYSFRLFVAACPRNVVAKSDGSLDSAKSAQHAISKNLTISLAVGDASRQERKRDECDPA